MMHYINPEIESHVREVNISGFVTCTMHAPNIVVSLRAGWRSCHCIWDLSKWATFVTLNTGDCETADRVPFCSPLLKQYSALKGL